MEVLASVIGSILTESCRFVFGYVRASINNFLKRQSNFNALKKDMSSLMHLRDDVQQKLDQQDRMGDVPRSQVQDWLGRVDELKRQVDTFLSSVSTSDGNNLQYSCSPYPLQCRLSSQLARKIEEVKQLTEAGNKVFEKMVDVSDKTNPVEHIPGPSIIGQETVSKNLASILVLLNDDKLTRIGVYGMGGVGKTTLVKNLNNELGKATSAQDFSVIIWATVSKEANLRGIQSQIADRLKLEVSTGLDEERMSILLHERLKKERRFLLILDDVWRAIDLDDLGIPELSSKSKIIITSRSLDVCRNMKTQADLQVKVLNDEEAWKLFCENAEEVVSDENIRPLAKLVAKECDGLPLAIIVVGKSMRRKSKVALWENALRALQMSESLCQEIEDKVFNTLKYSYDSLESKNIKSCFLFCCLYPEDSNIKVHELVRYWYCEGLLGERLNYKELKNQGIAIIESLIDCCLLEHGMVENSVNMHDLVRDVGIRIACSVEDPECRSLVRSGIGLTCVDKEFSHSYKYKRVSFMNNQIVELPDYPVVQYEEASTLLLQGNEKIEILPASFLEGFHALKILDLSGSTIKSLPPFQLHQLRALLLCECNFLTKLPPLDSLSRLLVLDCSHSSITQLPESLEKLSNLRQLDISNTPNLETIPYRAISKLSNLEFLNLIDAGSELSIDAQRLSEVLPCLKQLIAFYAYLDSIPHLISNNANWFGRIKEFNIFIGDRIKALDIDPHGNKNNVVLSGLCLSEESIELLLFNTARLIFFSCKGITQMFEKWATKNVSFAGLTSLSIGCSDSTFQPSPARCVVASSDLLPNLERIHLNDLSKLESISDLSKSLGLRFSRLKIICIVDCPQLKCLISLEENQTLEKLEEIDVHSCETLKCLFNYPNPRAQHMDLNPTVPNLQKVRLKNLPNLENLFRNDESLQNLKSLEFLGCHRIRKLPFTAQNADSIEKIEGEEEWWNQLEWDSDDAKMLLENHFIAFDFTGFLQKGNLTTEEFVHVMREIKDWVSKKQAQMYYFGETSVS